MEEQCWVEIETAERDKRRELVLQGSTIDSRISSSGGCLPPQLFRLSLLNYLEVSQCRSLRELQPSIGSLAQLQSLILCHNQLIALPAAAVGQLRNLRVLDVSDNQLQSLPAELGNLNELNTINVSCNRLKILPADLCTCPKLAVLNASHNELSSFPDEFFVDGRLPVLSTLSASENMIEELQGSICNLPSLKILDLSSNKLSELPFELADCPKLKEIHFKGNKLLDKRLEKMLNGCQTKAILDYLRAGHHGKGKGKTAGSNKEDVKEKDRKKKKDKRQKGAQNEEEDQVEVLNKLVIRVLHISESPAALLVKVTPVVKDVRPYIVCCLVRGMNLKPGNALKRFLAVQNKLHDEICEKRTAATIATHELKKVKGPLLYDARPPQTLKIAPLGRKEVKAANLVQQLKQDAEDLRKQKKRPNVSGLHKYLQLLDGKENFPCVVDADGDVISFPPITNSDKTKISKTTTDLFVEVTSSVSLQICKDVMDTLILKMAELNKFTFTNKETEPSSDPETDPTNEKYALGEVTSVDSEQPGSPELTVEQVRVVDTDGNLKVVYPAKTDLNMELSYLTVIR